MAALFDGNDGLYTANSLTGVDGSISLSGRFMITTAPALSASAPIAQVATAQAAGAFATSLEYYNDGGVLKLQMYSNFSTTDGLWRATSHTLQVGVWYGFCLTYDPSAVGNNPTLYVDGQIVALTRTTAPVGTYVAGADSLFLGITASLLVFAICGVAEVALWGSLLGEDDVKHISYGYDPRRAKVLPNYYWPIVSAYADIIAAITFTQVSAPTLAYHTPVLAGARKRRGVPPRASSPMWLEDALDPTGL